ncbi:hypothetical protein C4D60_Mb03t10540 [Musa balbisiana]|uniref:Ethylene insensitive 3-like DNA-binding domain-containing protein n=1 Tax=Musa balbisiana TaxID=52838 RepID=A0A4S8JBC6_MUSBA|nr:hypothetical protein C4D60_Mb03t10540 [Musa balbisiana]
MDGYAAAPLLLSLAHLEVGVRGRAYHWAVKRAPQHVGRVCCWGWIPHSVVEYLGPVEHDDRGLGIKRTSRKREPPTSGGVFTSCGNKSLRVAPPTPTPELSRDASNFEVDGVKHNNLDDNDVSDEEIESEELERRMWKDRVKLKRIKEREKFAAERAASERSKPKHTSDQARRKKMSRAQDGILKYMLKLMEVCNVRGFVYGIIPEKGKPVSGASDNIRAWWKEKVRFDKNGPAAIAKYEDREEPNSSSNDYDVDVLEDVSGSISSKDDGINLQVETQGCAGNITPTLREDRLAENSNQLGLSKDKTSEQPKRKDLVEVVQMLAG